MLKTETITKIAGLLKIKPEDLTTALTDEKEVDLVIDEKLSHLSEDEITTLKNNEYKAGKKAGEEMAVKEAKEKLGLDFAGKTVDGLLDAHSKKVLADAKIEPEKKVAELQEKLATVQTSYKELETKMAEKDTEVSAVKQNAELHKNVPAGTTLAQDKIIALMKIDGYDFKTVDGNLIALKDGKEVQDKLSNAVSLKDVIGGYVTENKLLADGKLKPEGRDKKDEIITGTFTKLSEIKEKFTAEGKSMLGTEFSKAVSDAAKVDGFDMNS